MLRGKQRDHTAARCSFDACRRSSQTPQQSSGRWSCQMHPPGLLTLLHLALRCLGVHGMTSSHCDVTTTPPNKGKKKACSHLLPSSARGNLAAKFSCYVKTIKRLHAQREYAQRLQRKFSTAALLNRHLIVFDLDCSESL